MSELATHVVRVNGKPCRVWEKGDGAPLVFLAGLAGLPRWPPLLERLSERYRVIAPSMPGHPGSLGHEQLDTHLDWIVATRDLIEGAGGAQAHLVGVSVGAALAAEHAALWNSCYSKLVLIAPLGLYDPVEPITDFWAQRAGSIPTLLCHEPTNFLAHTAAPAQGDKVEWEIEQVRASTAEARMLWPMCDTGVKERLHRILAQTLLIWGEEDRVISPSYAQRFSERITGEVTVKTVPLSGHLVDLDAPHAVATLVGEFLG